MGTQSRMHATRSRSGQLGPRAHTQVLQAGRRTTACEDWNDASVQTKPGVGLSSRARGDRRPVPSSNSMPLLASLLRGEGWRPGGRGGSLSESDATDNEGAPDVDSSDDD